MAEVTKGTRLVALDKGGAVHNVRAYGAQGDGVTDDTAAIQAAVDAAFAESTAGTWTIAGQTAGIVELPPGEYLVSGTITVPSYVRIRGSGHGTYISVDPAVGAGTEFSVFKVTTDGANGIVFADFLIDGNGAEFATKNASGEVTGVSRVVNGIEFGPTGSAAIYNQIRDVLIKEMSGNALKIPGSGANQLQVSNCILRDSYGHNVFISNSGVSSTFIGNTIRSAKNWDAASGGGRAGILIEASSNKILITGNRIEENAGDGVWVDNNAQRIMVEGNFFVSNGRYGIQSLNGSKATIVGNFIDQSGSYGMLIDLSDHIMVVANEIRSSDKVGILLGGVSHSRISDNLIHANNIGNHVDGDAINIQSNSDNNHVFGNTIRQNGGFQRNAIRIEPGTGCENNIIEHNDVRDSATSADIIADGGTGTIVRHNAGWVTEAHMDGGTFVVDAVGVKTLTIPHGLKVTPAKHQCQISVLQGTNVSDWALDWVRVKSTDGTNVTVEAKVGTASATAGATARIGLRVAIQP